MKKFLMVSTIVPTIAQFNMSNIHILSDMGYQVDVACNYNNSEIWPKGKIKNFKKEIKRLGGETYQISFSRKPIKIGDHIRSLKQMIFLLKTEKYEFIHTHTPMASAIARIAAHKTNTKVIYTVHGFHFYKGAPLRNWILFFPIEWLCSFWTDRLITLNQEDFTIAKRCMMAKRVEYVPGVGIDLQRFQRPETERVINRRILGIGQDDFLILSVGELNKNKNHETIIRAVAELDNKNIHYFIDGQGKLRKYLLKVIEQLSLQDQVHMLGYRNDIEQLYRAADLYILPSMREGLNVSLMEAMASSLPVVCSGIRGNKDLVVDKKGGFLCRAKKVSDYTKAIETLLASENIAKKMGEYNRIRIEGFGFTNVKKQMESIYQMISIEDNEELKNKNE